MTLRAMKPLRYNSRMLQVGEEFEPMAGDVRYLTARGRAEVVAEEDVPRRGRKAKAKAEPDPEPAKAKAEPEPAAAPAPEPAEEPEPTNAELREMAEARGIELPSSYVRNDDLVTMLAEHDAKAEDDGGRF